VAVHEIRIDRSKTLVEEPSTGHNRWHPDIPPVVRCEPGDEVVLETRDAFDGQMHRDATLVPSAALQHGMTMELVLVPFRTDDDGNEVVTFAFRPVG